MICFGAPLIQSRFDNLVMIIVAPEKMLGLAGLGVVTIEKRAIAFRCRTQSAEKNMIAALHDGLTPIRQSPEFGSAWIFVTVLDIALPNELGLYARLLGIHTIGPYPALIPFEVDHQCEAARLTKVDSLKPLLHFHQFLRFNTFASGKLRYQNAVPMRRLFLWVSTIHGFYPVGGCGLGRNPMVISRTGRHAINRHSICQA